MEFTIEKNNGNLDNQSLRTIAMYKRGVESIVKRNPDHAIELNAVVSESLNQVNADNWDELTVISAGNVNIMVQRKLSAINEKLNPVKYESNNEWIGQAIAAERAKGKNYGFD